MNFLPLIEAKRDGQAFSPGQIWEIVEAYTHGGIPDYQMSSFLMAIYFRGLNQTETRALTLAMRDSGERLSWPDDPRPVVDKHSTGGVGDKVSLVLAPLLACLGFRVPMISGRGLGITGGTLDKLESIPGFQTALPAGRIHQLVQEIGCVICGQTERMVPADRRLYALRDATGTVPSIPLIVASILSKKLAEGLTALVLDVKFGSGAFMPGIEQARALGQAMVMLGNDCGVATHALLTNMQTPLGRAAGNWLEVVESVRCLTPGRSAHIEDLRALVLMFAATLLVATGKADSHPEALTLAEKCLDSGEPLRKWEAMLRAQGADWDQFHTRLHGPPAAPFVAELHAASAGCVTVCDAKTVGETVRELGGGRTALDSSVDPLVGVDCLAKPGDRVESGATLARVHARTRPEGELAVEQLRSAIVVERDPGERFSPPRLVVESLD